MMGFWKFSSFLALGFLVLYQMGNLQAAPFDSDSQTNQTTPDPNQPPKEHSFSFIKFLRRIFGKREAPDSRITTQKRGCKLATCVDHNLAYLLNKYSGIKKPGFKPTNVGPTSYGRRRRELQK